MMRLGALAGLLLACLSLAACASAPAPVSADRAGMAAVSVPGVATMPPAPESYRIGALDLVDVKVFKVDDLNRTVRVDQGGMITLPLIGSVQAGGRTVNELEIEIERLYAVSYLQAPRVSVFVKEYASQRIAVTGAVVDPGLFFLNGPTSLLEAVSLAKGPNDVASTSDVALIRNQGGKRVGEFYDLDAIIAGTQSDPQIVGGDIVVVQQSGFKATMKEIMSVAPLLAIMRF